MENPITEQTKLKEVLATPSGHDIIARLLYSLGYDESVITKGIVGNLTVKGLKRFTFGKLNDDFIKALLVMLNSQTEVVEETDTAIKKAWWKEAVFYEIYPRSFKDSNDDGIGDLQGIISKLDYLKDLGVNAIWCTPVYDSPNKDNGYDIKDYRKIMAEFGTNEDCDQLIKEVHSRGMKLIMDLVMNHTSDQHEWFQSALKDENSPYADYYLWKEGDEKNPPNNWQSLFSGPAWNYYPEKKSWAMHLFADSQMDLNWDNEKVRKEMADIANWWVNKGVDGFRMDVVSFISKDPGLPSGDPVLGKLVGFTGIEHYFHGPKLDEYLREFMSSFPKKKNLYTVGECPGNGIKMSRLITGDDRGELTQVFSFDHTENPGKKRFDYYRFDLRKMAPELVRWQTLYGNHCWPTLFYENHDLPRMTSKVCLDGRFQNELSKLLGLLQFSLKGTPYIYQGQELGMTNYPFAKVEEFKDVESLNKFDELTKKKMKKEKAFELVAFGSRDNARTPFPWDSSVHAGFSKTDPWLKVNPNYSQINVETETSDPNSVLNFFKKLIKFRKDHPALIYGEFKKLPANKNYLIYYREDAKEKFYLEFNLTPKYQTHPKVEAELELLISNYQKPDTILHPFEANLYQVIKPKD